MNTPFLLFLLYSSFSVGFAAVGSSGNAVAGEKTPFAPKAFLIRYWDNKITNNLPKPPFLLSKASPLSAVESAIFAKLAASNALSTRLPEFCSSAHLFCFPQLARSLERHNKDVNFAVYQDFKNFTNYGSDRLGGGDSFKNYSDGENTGLNDFRRYSRDSAGHKDNFLNYGPEGNEMDQGFNGYGTGATGGAGEFKRYANSVNVPELRFTSYSDGTNGRSQSFSSYSNNANAGDQAFTSYGKNGNGALSEFTSYLTDSNVIASNFSNYGETANGATDKFKNYGVNMNVPVNIFKNYGDGGNAATNSFTSYRDDSNIGFDSFQSYAKNSNAAKVDFTSYGKGDNMGTDTFTGYGKGAKGHKVGFKGYIGSSDTYDFKEYAKKGVSFARYKNDSSTHGASMAYRVTNVSLVNKWVEPGKFFRELMLKEGMVMPMPDIRDRMPERSFLPRSVLSKLPFSTSKIFELKQIFMVADNSSMEMILMSSLRGSAKGHRVRVRPSGAWARSRT